MIQPRAYRRAGRVDVPEIRDEAGRGLRTAFEGHLDLERMAMHGPVRVAFGKVVEVMRGIEAEAIGDFQVRRVQVRRSRGSCGFAATAAIADGRGSMRSLRACSLPAAAHPWAAGRNGRRRAIRSGRAALLAAG